MSNIITVIESADVVAKRFTRAADGTVTKSAIATIKSGKAVMIDVPTAERMVEVLRDVTESNNKVIVPARFHGVEVGEEFQIVTEAELARMLSADIGSEALAGVHEVRGSKVAARLRRSVTASSWQLLDADNPPGITEELKALRLGERLKLWAQLVPGLADAEMIALRSSSARVLLGGVPVSSSSHAWIRLADPEDLDRFRAAIIVHAMLVGCGFMSPRYSRKEPGNIVGHAPRSVFDASVFTPGRIVFCAQPILVGEGLQLAAPSITIRRGNGKLVDTSTCKTPTPAELTELRNRFALDLQIKIGKGGRVVMVDRSSLTEDTEIETDTGTTTTVGEWLKSAKVDKVRIQTPFRESSSWAAFLRRTDTGGLLHDVGTGVTYTLGINGHQLIERDNDDDVIARLAVLSPIAYDQCRKAEADALGIRASTLDAQVLEARRCNGGNDTEGAGTSLTFDTIEPWPSAVDGAELLEEIIAIFCRHAVLPDHSAIALALWSVFTHMHQGATVCPMLLLSSPVKGCGKTTVLSVLGLLVDRPLAASNVTAAAMFRAIEAWTPTLLIDEADSFARDNEELRGVLNSGHTRTSAFVLRTVGDEHEVKQFSTWCPKALAGIGRLPGTVTDRSVIVSMRRKSRGEQVARLRPRQRYDDTRSKIARWARDHTGEFGGADPAIPGDLANRTADNWMPLLAIADLTGGDWPSRARTAAMAMNKHDVDGDGVGVRLLADIRMLFTEHGLTKYRSVDLLKHLTELDDSPWSEINRGKPMTPNRLSKMLNDFDIVRNTIRDGGDIFKGYRIEQFADAFERYLSQDASNTASKSVTQLQPNADAACNRFEIGYTDHVLPNQNRLQPNVDAACDRVTDLKPGNSGFAQSVPENDSGEAEL